MNDNHKQSATEALFQALKPASPQEQLSRLSELNKRIEEGQFLLRRNG